jgi:hypothetical protein
MEGFPLPELDEEEGVLRSEAVSIDTAGRFAAIATPALHTKKLATRPLDDRAGRRVVHKGISFIEANLWIGKHHLLRSVIG